MNRPNLNIPHKMKKHKPLAPGSEENASVLEHTWRTSGLGIVGYVLAGLISGTLLGLLLKWIQSWSGHRVYRLLLNADYVPVLKEFSLSETTEFIIHLVISMVLCVVLGILWQYRFRRAPYSLREMAIVTAGIGLAIGLLLYPTTLLSSGGTPPITSIPAWSWWLLVHAVYGAVSGLLLGCAFHMRLQLIRNMRSRR